MADSEDEYDRRRGRDKFRRERNDYNDRNSGNRRDDWQESRESGGTGVSWNNQNRDRIPQRRDYRDNYSIGGSGAGGGGGGGGAGNPGGNQRRDRYSPADRSDMSPPMKRVRGGRDWDDRTPYPNYEMGGYGAHHNTNNWNQMENNGPNAQNQNQHRENDTGPTQPPMMTFKQFLGTQDDGIDDQIAVQKYSDYKLEFKKRQIFEFFTAHKDEEWFRSKYHPEECDKRKVEQTNAVRNRLEVFLDLLAKDWIDSVSIDVEKANQIIRLLDAVVIKLEGGSDFDLKALDENYEEEKAIESDLALFSVDVEKPRKSTERKSSKESEKEAGEESDSEGVDKKPDISENNAKDVENEDNKEVNDKEKDVQQNNKPENVNMDSMASMEEGEASMDANSESKATLEEEPQDSEDKVVVKQEDKRESPVKANTSANDIEKPRPLHKTVSIFFRNLAPSITKLEIEELCRRYPGLLRVCIADPTSERRFYRRGWATYENTVNIKEICWAFNGQKIRDCDLGVQINRDLSRRIRSVNGIASHKNVVRADIRHAAKIVLNLDQQRKLWDEENGVKDSSEAQPMFGFASKNPLLKNITDYLIEEASAEEEELLGTSEIGELDDGEDNENNVPSLDRDESLIKVLDRLLLYLRVVHSLDYYSHCDYPNEDEMPNRIGLMHARGMVSTSSRVTQQEINEYIKNFETKVQPFLQPPTIVTEEEAKKLGLKDPEEEAENFIKLNTQELAKDKWLCPLSAKKFKGPEFVRKHILNKHIERVEEAKKTALYLNNYIFDPKRPQLPEHPINRMQKTPNRNEGGIGMAGGMGPGYIPPGPYPGPPPYMAGAYGPRGPPMGGFGGPMMGYGRGYPPMGMGGPMHEYGRGPMHQKPRFTRRDPRNIVEYEDIEGMNDMV